MTDESEMARVRLTISINADVIKWIDEQVDQGTYYNRSHAIEKCLIEKMKKQSADVEA